MTRPGDKVVPLDPDSVERPEYTATWRVFSDDLPLAELCAALGEPSHSHDRGDLVSPRRPDGLRRKHARWSIETPLERSEPLERHIEALVDAAERRADALEALRPHVDTDIFCGVFRRDFGAESTTGGTIVFGCGGRFDVDLLTRLAALRLPVTLDVY